MSINDRLEDLCQQALEKWGDDVQLLKAVEELNELRSTLLHYRYNKVDRNDVLNELADVAIICNQLMIMFDITNTTELSDVIHVKLDKLEKALNK